MHDATICPVRELAICELACPRVVQLPSRMAKITALAFYSHWKDNEKMRVFRRALKTCHMVERVPR